MALIEAAYASIRSSICTPSRFESSITLLSKRRLSGSILLDLKNTQKTNRLSQTYFHQFRRTTGLSEWCEKKMEFSLLFGKPKITEAIMKAGIARHAKLEAEVLKKEKLCLQSNEDIWALKFINSINGVNHLLFKGLTRELPLISFEGGICLVGVIDEIRMLKIGKERKLMLVDIKTRVRDSLPAEPQRRNARLQLMIYNKLCNTLVADSFPSGPFFYLFALDPNFILSEAIRETASNSGFPAKTLDDIVKCYRNTWSMLPPAQHHLLLRYELQKDQSVIGEDLFEYDPVWLDKQIQDSLGF